MPAVFSNLCRVAAILALLLAPVPAHAETTLLAPASHADFSVRVFWLAHARGRFDRVHGDIQWSARHDTGTVHAWIDVDSVDAGSRKHRKMLLAPGFLDVHKYPRIHFVSDPVALGLLHRGGTLRGMLTMHGVRRRVRFTLAPSRCRLPVQVPCILRLRGSVRRKAFGMTGHAIVVANRVHLELVIVLQPKASSPPDATIRQPALSGTSPKVEPAR